MISEIEYFVINIGWHGCFPWFFMLSRDFHYAECIISTSRPFHEPAKWNISRQFPFLSVDGQAWLGLREMKCRLKGLADGENEMLTQKEASFELQPRFLCFRLMQIHISCVQSELCLMNTISADVDVRCQQQRWWKAIYSKVLTH